MSVGIVGPCAPLSMEDQCSVCSPASGYELFCLLVQPGLELKSIPHLEERNFPVFSTETSRYPKKQLCKQTVFFLFELLNQSIS